MSKPNHDLTTTLTKLLDKRQKASKLRTLKASPPGSVDLSSNDFLSLATSPALREIFLKELSKDSVVASHLGSGGSRLLDGNSAYAEALERDIADFHNSPDGLLCNSGYDANVALFSSIPQPGDIILHDELIHASVHDGMRISRAGSKVPFRHNSITDLRKVLESLVSTDDAVKCGAKNIFIAVESVYSMDGDVAPLADIVNTVEDVLPQKNGHIIVDEAHSTGVFGSQGRGLVCELGLESHIFARLHTFGKALACNGAIVLCSSITRLYLINYGRSLIYTTFMSFPTLAAIRAVYTLMQQGGIDELARGLRVLVNELYHRLEVLRLKYGGARVVQGLVEFPTVCPESQIFSLLTHEPRSLAKFCQDAGFIVRPVVPPTVPSGTERVRICLHAGNTKLEINGLVERIEAWILTRLELPERPRL